MIHNDALKQLDLLVKRAAPPLLEVARDASREEPVLAPGERVQAYVLASLPNGRFHVLIKDQVLDMNLPPNTQPGEALDLAVIKTEPRLTFAVAADIQRAIERSPADVRLSDASKYLGNLLARTPADSSSSRLAVQAAPLLATASDLGDTALLAGKLQNSLSGSGVFFESHQAEWVSGQRTLQQLLGEPQARFGQTGSPLSVARQTPMPAPAASTTLFSGEPYQPSANSSATKPATSLVTLSVPPAAMQSEAGDAPVAAPVGQTASMATTKPAAAFQTGPAAMLLPGQSVDEQIVQQTAQPELPALPGTQMPPEPASADGAEPLPVRAALQPVSQENLPVGEPLPEMAGAEYPSPAVTSAAAMPLDGQTERLSDMADAQLPAESHLQPAADRLAPPAAGQTTVKAREPDVLADVAPDQASLTPAARGLGPSGDIAAEPAVSRPLSPGEVQQLRELVQQQLHCLDTRQLAWQGLAWPNQMMDWTVEERDARPGADPEAQAGWFSRLHLELPRLGGVTASIALQGGQFRIHFDASPETAEVLRDAQSVLASRFAAAGLSLLGATVDHEQR